MSLIFCLGARSDWTFRFFIQNRSLPKNCIFWKGRPFFVEVESRPDTPQLAIYSSRQSSTSHILPRIPGAPQQFFSVGWKNFIFITSFFLFCCVFGTEFCKFLNFESGSYFLLRIFKNDSRHPRMTPRMLLDWYWDLLKNIIFSFTREKFLSLCWAMVATEHYQKSIIWSSPFVIPNSNTLK